MRRTFLASLLGCALMVTGAQPVWSQTKKTDEAPAPKSSGGQLVANINLSSQNMTVTVDGRTVHTWAISSGASGHETPTGSFRPQWAVKMHFSSKYDDAPMPHSVFFNGGIATHGTGSIGRLGSPASHGCIRLAPGNAQTFFNLVHQYGFQSTRIVVRGSTPSQNYARRQSREDRYAYADRTQRPRPSYSDANQAPTRRMAANARTGSQPRYAMVRPQPTYLFGNW